MCMRLGITTIIICLATGCGRSEKLAIKDVPGDPAKLADAGQNPKTDSGRDSRIAHGQALLNKYLRVLKNTNHELNQITNNETALSAAKQLHENAQTVQEIATKVKAIGRLSHEEHIRIRVDGLEEAQVAHSSANKKIAALIAAGSLPAKSDKAVRGALIAWGRANIAFSDAARTIVPPRKPGNLTWKEFVPPKGDFSVKFPSLPTPGKAGAGREQFQIAAVKPDTVNDLGFAVYWRYRTKPFRNATVAQDYLKGQQKGIAAKGKLISEKKITVGKQVGREFIVILNSITTLRCRLFVIEKLICTLIIRGRDPKAVQSGDADRFLRSFKLKSK